MKPTMNGINATMKKAALAQEAKEGYPIMKRYGMAISDQGRPTQPPRKSRDPR